MEKFVKSPWVSLFLWQIFRQVEPLCGSPSYARSSTRSEMNMNTYLSNLSSLAEAIAEDAELARPPRPPAPPLTPP